MMSMVGVASLVMEVAFNTYVLVIQQVLTI